MTLDEAIEIICKDYCKYPDIESGNKLAEGYADRQIADTLSKVEPINTKL